MRRRLRTFGIVLVALGLSIVAAVAEVPAIAQREKAEKRTFTDAEISDGFMKTAFGAEYQLAGHVDRIRKYHKPVRVFVGGVAHPDRRKQLADVVADIDKHIPNVDIAMTSKRGNANVFVTFVRDRNLDGFLRRFYGNKHAREIRDKLNPQCLSGFRKDRHYQIEHSEVVLTVDKGDFIFLDCAYEELLQSLGPINDTSSVPWTMFNDNVSMGFFDIYDQYLMNILYDPRIRAGMSMKDVRPVLPKILPDVRAIIARLNDLPEAAAASSR